MAVTQPSGGKRVTTSGDLTMDGLGLLESDIGVALILMGRGRRVAIQRLFGTPAHQDNLVTLVALSLLVHAVHEKAHRIFAASANRSAADWMLGAASAREALYGVSGPGLRGTPWLGALLLLAVTGKTAPRALSAYVRNVRTSSRHMTVSFSRRYGHLVNPAHRRSRRTSPYESAAR
jgi:hypothetical protein